MLETGLLLPLVCGETWLGWAGLGWAGLAWTWLLAASLKLLYFCLNPRPVSGVRQQLTVPTGNSISPGHKSKLMVSCWSRRKLVPFMFCERLRLILEIANRICQAISRFLIATHATLLRPRPCFQFSLFVHPAAGRSLTLSRTLPADKDLYH